MNSTIQFITNFFTKGHDRSVKAKKNILASLLIKGLSIGISLVLVPLTINYVNPSRYGIWLTLSSIVAWFSFFDIGLTQGLRNKFAEAKAKNDDFLAQIYVSTSYAILAIIFLIVWIIFIVVNQFVDWTIILNVSENMRSEVSVLAVIIFTYFCLQFVLKIITTLILADQQPAKASSIELIGQVLSLTFIIILVKTTEGSLILLGLALCISPLLVLFAANLFLFKGSLKKYRPNLYKVKFRYTKSLFNVGITFFIIQVAMIIQYQTANIIIAQNFGTTDVTSYNIVFKYFGVLNMAYSIFLIPFWSASTEAFLNEDIPWIKNAVKKYNKLNVIIFAVGCIMLIFSESVYRLWIGEGKVEIDFYLSFWGFIYFNVLIFGGKYVDFLNGISALRIQFISSLISPVLYIVVAILLIKNYHMGVYSLFIASIIANFNAYLLSPLQYHMVINKNKKGIWIK